MLTLERQFEMTAFLIFFINPMECSINSVSVWIDNRSIRYQLGFGGFLFGINSEI